MRRLGQHFLSDPAILDRIVGALEPEPDDVVIEIGPGKGSLTERLLRRVGRVIAIEKDRALAAALPSHVSRLPSHEELEQGARSREQGARGIGELTVVEGDALKLDWHAMVPSHVSRLTSHVPRLTKSSATFPTTSPPRSSRRRSRRRRPR